MALTLTSNIDPGTNPVPLSGSPSAPAFSIDVEIFAVVGTVPPAQITVPSFGAGGAGRLVGIPAVVTVERGYAGTAAAAHAAGAAVTPLWPVLSVTPGKTV